MSRFFPKISAVKFAIKLWIVEKRWKQVVLEPPIFTRKAPQILDMRFKISLTSENVAGFGW